MANKYGHKVLRLPSYQYHCMFNPIEHIWGIAKIHYKRHNGQVGSTEIACLNMRKESLDTVNEEIWKNSVHTEEEIRRWYEREHTCT